MDVEANILRTELLKREAKEEVLRGLEVVVVMEVAIMVLEGTIVVSRQWVHWGVVWVAAVQAVSLGVEKGGGYRGAPGGFPAGGGGFPRGGPVGAFRVEDRVEAFLEEDQAGAPGGGFPGAPGGGFPGAPGGGFPGAPGGGPGAPGGGDPDGPYGGIPAWLGGLMAQQETVRAVELPTLQGNQKSVH